MSTKDREEIRIPMVIVPPEISELYLKIDEIDKKVDSVLGEIAQKEGLKLGSHIGFFYGFLAGSLIILILKFVLRAL
jgi:N5-methyltetrahydromethanopterin:coenzyme M methyltransferase subunit G